VADRVDASGAGGGEVVVRGADEHARLDRDRAGVDRRGDQVRGGWQDGAIRACPADEAADVRVQAVQHQERADHRRVQGTDHGDPDPTRGQRGEGLADTGRETCRGHDFVLDPAPLRVHGSFGGRTDGSGEGEDDERVLGARHLPRQPVLCHQRPQPIGHRQPRQPFDHRPVQRHQQVIAFREQLFNAHDIPPFALPALSMPPTEVPVSHRGSADHTSSRCVPGHRSWRTPAAPAPSCWR
jgi:hypothetical protein